jgi:hypothetical protein
MDNKQSGVVKMDEELMIQEMAQALEDSGEITLTGEELEIFIQSVDDKEGYAYVSNTNKEFEDSTEAIEWAVLQFDGVENIEEWE